MKVPNALNARPSRRGVRPEAIDDRPRAVWVTESPPILSGPAPTPMLPWFYPRRAGRCPMSTMMKIRSRFPSHSKVGEPAPITATGQGRHSSHPKPIRPEEEPQEDSVRVTEPRSRGKRATPKPPTPDEEFPTPLLKASLPTAEAGAERSGQAKWPARRPHRTVPSATPLDGSYLGTDIEFLTPG